VGAGAQQDVMRIRSQPPEYTSVEHVRA